MYLNLFWCHLQNCCCQIVFKLPLVGDLKTVWFKCVLLCSEAGGTEMTIERCMQSENCLCYEFGPMIFNLFHLMEHQKIYYTFWLSDQKINIILILHPGCPLLYCPLLCWLNGQVLSNALKTCGPRVCVLRYSRGCSTPVERRWCRLCHLVVYSQIMSVTTFTVT